MIFKRLIPLAVIFGVAASIASPGLVEAAPASSFLQTGPSIRTLATPAPESSVVEKTYYYRRYYHRRYYRPYRRYYRPRYYRPYYRHYYHPYYRSYYHRRYWHPFYF